MDSFTTSDLRILAAERPGPCVSLYAPVHPGGSEQDPVRWKNLLREAEHRLEAAGVGPLDAKALLRPAARLLEDDRTWRAGGSGLAYFLAPGFDRRVRLDLNWPERVSVGRAFDVKPLLPWVAAAGRFFVLALSQNAVRLVRCTPHTAERVPLAGPADRAEALRAHDRDEPLTLRTFGPGPGARRAVFHGHGVGIDDAKDDLLLFCRAVDRELHPALKDELAPLVLAAVEFLAPIVRQACTYPHLHEEVIPGNPDRLSDQELAERARPLAEPLVRRAEHDAVALYRQLAGTGRTACDVAEVLPAAAAGRVEALLAALGRGVWGRYDPAAGRVDAHAGREPGDDELTNLAAVFALRHGRPVYALPADEMPDGAALAAIFPLPLAKRGKRP
jgi:hypothetical protein